MLSRFQNELARALTADDPIAACAPEFAPLFAQPGFAVYRNTVIKACVDALEANYPAVRRLVGDEWFRAAAAIHARRNLPGDPMLVAYGEGFEAFLAGFEPAGELPYLPAVARLDRFWTEAHVAADAPVVDAGEVAALEPEALAHAVLRPHPGARWAWFDEMPIRTIWQRNRADDPAPPGEPGESHDEIEWHGEGVLVVRPVDRVESISIDAGACAFLDACARGETMGDAAAAAMNAQPGVDLARLIASLLGAGAFARVDTINESTEET